MLAAWVGSAVESRPLNELCWQGTPSSSPSTEASSYLAASHPSPGLCSRARPLASHLLHPYNSTHVSHTCSAVGTELPRLSCTSCSFCRRCLHRQHTFQLLGLQQAA